MSLDRAVFAISGSMVLLSAVLVWLVSPWFLLLTAFLGLNMIQLSFTGFCPMARLLKASGMKTGVAFH